MSTIEINNEGNFKLDGRKQTLLRFGRKTNYNLITRVNRSKRGDVQLTPLRVKVKNVYSYRKIAHSDKFIFALKH